MKTNLSAASLLSLILLSNLCFLHHTQAQTLATIYLAVRTDGIAGTGTLSDPFNASTAAKYDHLLATHPRNTVYRYAPGTYKTTGWYYRVRQSAGTNCKHYGAGIGQTIIQLVGANTTTNDGVIFGSDYDVTADGFEIQNMTLDCNPTGNPNFVHGLGSVTAINTQGSNLLIKSVKVINFGTAIAGSECFAVFIYPGSSLAWRSFNNVQVENCIFTSPAHGNKDGLTCVFIGQSAGVQSTNTSIVNSSFINLRSDFLYSHAFYAQRCTGNKVQGCEVGTYVEPAEVILTPWLVQNNTFTDVSEGATICFHSGGRVQELRFLNNLVILSNTFGNWSTVVDVIEPNDPPIPNNFPEVVSLIIQGNSIQPTSATPAYNPYYVGFDIQSPNRRCWIGNLQITGNKFASAAPQNNEQILVSNSPQFLGSSSISANFFGNGSPVTVNLQPVLW
jgi:hypothetical protein